MSIHHSHEQAIKLYCMSLKKELEKTIRGSIYLEPIGDNLHITIHTPIGKVYQHTEYNIYNKIVQGIPTNTLSDYIVKSHKNFINFTFFIK